jgi:hypothetical protein
MNVDGKHTRTIWLEADGITVGTIDQTLLPHRFETIPLKTVEDAARAIKTMQVRGAPLPRPLTGSVLRPLRILPTRHCGAPMPCCWRRVRPRSISNGRLMR